MMKPEQDMINNMIVRTADTIVEYLMSFQSRHYPWVSPIVELGPQKVAQVTLEAIVRELYSFGAVIDNPRSTLRACDTLHEYQDVVRAVAHDLVFTAKYHSAKQENRGAWVLANRAISGAWKKRTIQNFIKTHTHADVRITNRDRYILGCHLINIFEKAGLVKTFNRYQDTRQHKLITLTDDVINALLLGHHEHLTRMKLRYSPMIVPPIAHTQELVGGAHLEYLRKSVVRDGYTFYKGDDFITTYKGSEPSTDTIKALNKLMSTEWCINAKVLDIMQQLFESNARCCGLPPSERDEILFQEVFDVSDKGKLTTISEEKRNAYDEWYKSVNNRLRMKSLFRVARDLDSHGFFYHTWTCDFRGRMYTTTELLSPQAGDTDKGMLLFANPYERTDRAEYWLKIQIANLFGIDKVSRKDRIKWVDSNMGMLRAINDDPMSHIDLWEDDALKKNTSFQRLANIFELFRTDGMLQIPIFIDGSCNGYQHWAAMTRDVSIARLVNLIPSDKPGDIYQVVADKVTELMVEKDDEWARIFLTYWDGKIPRGVVKRAVMTDPYGVTFEGIVNGLISDKKLTFVGKDWKIRRKSAESMATYLVSAMDNLLVVPNRAKKWLKFVTKLFAERNIHAEWVVPSGFSVMHDYHGTSTTRIDIQLTPGLSHNNRVDAKMKLRFNEYDRDLVDSGRAVNGISPNFVHSLDASHMCSVILRLDEAGCTDMAFVHDSYGAPATWIDRLMGYTQEEFVKIHKVNQLELLKSQWEQQLGFELPPLPDTGDLDINQVLESEYFFH